MKRERLLRIWTSTGDALAFRKLAYIEEMSQGDLLHKLLQLYREKMKGYTPEMSQS